MPNYRELYIELCRATEKAIALLREAQESFETQYMAEFNPEFDWSSFPYTVEEEKKDSE